MSELLCINCPRGCRLTAEFIDDVLSVNGNACKRGIDFAKNELTCPMRSLTTTLRTIYPDIPVVPVRTDGEIRLSNIKKAIEELSSIVINKPYSIGDVVVYNIAGEPCNVIITSSVLKEKNDGFRGIGSQF